MSYRYRIRGVTFFCKLATLSVIFAVIGTDVRATDKRPSGDELVRQSSQLIDIRDQGGRPFRMHATVHASSDGAIITGDYDLKWQSPTSWREEIRLDKVEQLRIADGDKLWEERNLPYFTASVERLTKVTDFSRLVGLLGNEHSKKVQDRVVNGSSVLCIEVREKRFHVKDVCLQPKTNLPVRIEYSKQNGGGGFEFEDFISFGGHQFPRVMQEFGSKPELDFRVEELSEMQSKDPTMFIPSSNARSYRWCPNADVAEHVGDTLVIPPDIADILHGSHAVIYGVIGIDDGWHDLAIVQSSGNAPPSAWFRLMGNDRFHPSPRSSSITATHNPFFFAENTMWPPRTTAAAAGGTS